MNEIKVPSKETFWKIKRELKNERRKGGGGSCWGAGEILCGGTMHLDIN